LRLVHDDVGRLRLVAELDRHRAAERLARPQLGQLVAAVGAEHRVDAEPLGRAQKIIGPIDVVDDSTSTRSLMECAY